MLRRKSMMTRKIIAMIFSLALVLSVRFPVNAQALGKDNITFAEKEKNMAEEVCAEEGFQLYLAEKSIGQADAIAFDTDYTGVFSEDSYENYYKVELEASGRVTININSEECAGAYYYLFNSDDEQVMYGDWEFDPVTGQISGSDSMEVTKGTYYLCVGGWYEENQAGYSLKLSFISAEESFPETGYGTNNEFRTANDIETGVTYKGQLAENDEKDYYRITLEESGEIALNVVTKMEAVTCCIYDSEGNELWGESYSWNRVTEQIIGNKSMDLTQGTYYLVVDQSWWNKGNYEFTTYYSGKRRPK